MVEDLIREAGPAQVQAERRPLRALSIFAALALVAAGVMLARHGADPVKSDPKVVVDSPQFDNVGSAIGQTLGFGAPQAQIINISAIVCPILNGLIAAIPFLGPILAPLLAAFGCISI